MSQSIPTSSQVKVAVIGGGVAGSTIALRLSELGIKTTLFEKGPSLVNGPPMCHLHAGGNLYRDISDEQCFTLLQQSIDTLKVFRHCVDWRPTVIALPTTDKSTPAALLPRLYKLQQRYRELVADDETNEVLGSPEHYFRPYEREQLEALAKRPTPKVAQGFDDWLIPVAKTVNLDTLQFPVFLVQEYGLSAFRFAAAATLAMKSIADCELRLNHQIVAITDTSGALAPSGSLETNDALATNSTPATNGAVSKRWQLSYKDSAGALNLFDCDYVVNACGFRSGEIDDLLNLPRQRLVEFKAAYVAHWPDTFGQWPEVIIHGERGTPQGMAQLTPYPNGFFQLHGMTHDITLFEGGLVASHATSAQPKLSTRFLNKIEHQWPEQEVASRTQAAVNHASQFFPAFANAKVAAKPLYGAQQIPGTDPGLRAADVSFCSDGYARAEIVKASSALAASDAILGDLKRLGLTQHLHVEAVNSSHYFPATKSLTQQGVVQLALKIAAQRDYSEALAEPIQSAHTG
ncbi:FAD-dependent oxidoreductase [Neiella holothuriorum]|uniref:FAD-dependent oxidoreductase n=1 Tax=Neiella holothuriorum TaxID=2870530 RepID=UPI00298FAFD9|nr:FAD-dependent oxidoreductase [Neiella holothuriorum]